MNVVAVSDLHGFLPELPPADLVLICGDICPPWDRNDEFQEYWLDTAFRKWLMGIKARKIVGVAGNHDFIFQVLPHKVPPLPWVYLEDSGTEFENVKIWGSPWQPYFCDWAFNLYEADLEKKWQLIPLDTDILVLHGPPHGYGDQAPRLNTNGFVNTGSPSLLKRIKEIEPRLVVFGHIHEARGRWELKSGTTLANVSVVDGNYELIHSPMTFELGR